MNALSLRTGTVALKPASSFTCLALLVLGCSSGSPGDEPDAGADAAVAVEEIELAIVNPPPGSTHVRDFVGQYGALVALVELEVQASGPYARISFEIPDGDILGNPGADLVLPAEFRTDGSMTVTAVAYDLDGNVAATDTVELTVEAPQPSSCREWLDLYGLEYTVGPDRPGVDDPVTVVTPINGVSYRYVSFETPRATFFMHCGLALALARSAYHLRWRDVVEVADIGVYNYRCIGGVGTPPDCPQGISQHAYAKGIDIAGYTTGDGTYYSVNDDWLIDEDGESTCDAPTEPGKDRFLHEAICDQKADGVFNIVLTPNFNAGHRNHFHVDITEGSDFINRSAIDIGPDAH